MSRALTRHDELLRELITSHGGWVVKHLGDGVFAVFEEGEPLDRGVVLSGKPQVALQ